MNLRTTVVALSVVFGTACGGDTAPAENPTPQAPRGEATKKKATAALPPQGRPAKPAPPKADPAPPAGIVADRAVPLSNGTFSGPLSSENLTGEITLIVRDGVLVSATAEVIAKQRVEFTFKPRGAGDARRISLIGSVDGSFIQLTGGFLDTERASGVFNGTVNKKRVSGRWYGIRR